MMDRLRGWWQQLRVVLRFSQAEDELARELADHFEREVERQRAAGGTESEARRLAALRVGMPESLKEEVRDARGGRLVLDAMSDLRVGLRGLRRAPGFTTAVIVSLALGVAGVTAIFSVLNAVVIRALPYPDAERLHLVRVAWNEFTASLSAADYLRLKDASGSVAVGAYRFGQEGYTLLGHGPPQVIAGAALTPETPRVLGVRPTLGRWFTEGDESAEALISDRLWRERFGGRPDVPGTPLPLDSGVYTVVGVMPPGFDVPGQTRAQVWLSSPVEEPPRRGPYYLRVVARLAPVMAAEQEAVRLTAAVTPVLFERYQAEATWRYLVTSMKDSVIGDTAATLWLFLAAVCLVLVIACANVANLMLARGTARAHELAVRAALGARRERLLRQLLTESSILGIGGALLGLVGAAALVRAIVTLAGGLLPRVDEIAVDGFAATVAVAAGLGTATVAGVVPALWLTRQRAGPAMREGARGVIGNRQGRARRWLVIAEVALALGVLVATTLLVKSLTRLEATPPGFEPDNVLAFRLVAPPDPYDDTAKLDAYLDAVEARLQALPGVSTVAFAESLPPDRLQQSNNYTLKGEEPGSAGRGTQGSGVAQWNVVSPSYFGALGLPVVRGRGFTRDDLATAPRVAVVSRSFVDRHFAGRDPIGAQFKGGDWDASAPWTTVVGVVGDVPYEQGVWGGTAPTIYVPYAQNAGSRWQFVVLRGRQAPRLGPALTAAVQDIDPRVPLRDVASMRERLAASALVPRLRMRLFSLLAIVAMVLAITGIYGVLAFQVRQRRKETAVRVALGASPRAILADVVTSGLALAVIGTAAGVGAAWAMSRGLSSFLYGVDAHDVGSYMAAIVVLLAAAAVASLVPAIRAVRVEPVAALRED